MVILDQARFDVPYLKIAFSSQILLYPIKKPPPPNPSSFTLNRALRVKRNSSTADNVVRRSLKTLSFSVWVGNAYPLLNISNLLEKCSVVFTRCVTAWPLAQAVTVKRRGAVSTHWCSLGVTSCGDGVAIVAVAATLYCLVQAEHSLAAWWSYIIAEHIIIKFSTD